MCQALHTTRPRSHECRSLVVFQAAAPSSAVQPSLVHLHTAAQLDTPPVSATKNQLPLDPVMLHPVSALQQFTIVVGQPLRVGAPLMPAHSCDTPGFVANFTICGVSDSCGPKPTETLASPEVNHRTTTPSLMACISSTLASLSTSAWPRQPASIARSCARHRKSTAFSATCRDQTQQCGTGIDA